MTRVISLLDRLQEKGERRSTYFQSLGLNPGKAAKHVCIIISNNMIYIEEEKYVKNARYKVVHS